MMPAASVVVDEESSILAQGGTYYLAGTYPTIVVYCSVAPPVRARECQTGSVCQGILFPFTKR